MLVRLLALGLVLLALSPSRSSAQFGNSPYIAQGFNFYEKRQLVQAIDFGRLAFPDLEKLLKDEKVQLQIWPTDNMNDSLAKAGLQLTEHLQLQVKEMNSPVAAVTYPGLNRSVTGADLFIITIIFDRRMFSKWPDDLGLLGHEIAHALHFWRQILAGELTKDGRQVDDKELDGIEEEMEAYSETVSKLQAVLDDEKYEANIRSILGRRTQTDNVDPLVKFKKELAPYIEHAATQRDWWQKQREEYLKKKASKS